MENALLILSGVTVSNMVSLYFGLPGCGKTTTLAMLALRASRQDKYKHVYTNVQLNGIPKVVTIKNSDIGTFYLKDALILIDEGTIFADSRDYKNFSKNLVEYFLLHRHYNVDIAIFAQQWDGVDKKIRVITDRVYYIFKPFFTGFFRSRIWKIPYDIVIPSKKDNGSAKYGEIVQGYFKPPFLLRLFSPSIYRYKYYPYFDSWTHKVLPNLPEERFKEQTSFNSRYFDSVQSSISKIRFKPFKFFKNKRFLKRKKYFNKIMDRFPL